MEGRRGVRRLAAVLVVLSCLVPAGAEAQPSTLVTTTTTTSGTTGQSSSSSSNNSVGVSSAVMGGGTTTTSLSPTAISAETDDAVLSPAAPAAAERAEQSSPPPEDDAAAPGIALTGAPVAELATSSLQSPVEGTTTTASPPSIVIADSDQGASADESGEPVRLAVVRSDFQIWAPLMLLLALVLFVAPSVIQAGRRMRR